MERILAIQKNYYAVLKVTYLSSQRLSLLKYGIFYFQPEEAAAAQRTRDLRLLSLA